MKPFVKEMVQGYCEAAFWTDFEHPDNEEQCHTLSISFVKQAIADCVKFLRYYPLGMPNGVLFKVEDTVGYEYSRLGHDFWLTRNHHGTGFWDRDELGETVGRALTKFTHDNFKQVDTYIGDDGKGYAL